VQTPRRIELDPASAPREVAALISALPQIAGEIEKMKVDPALVSRALAQLTEYSDVVDWAAADTPRRPHTQRKSHLAP
jgi:hypothetical protein